MISNLYRPLVSFCLINISKQKGGADCGLFAIAITTTLALGLDTVEITFQQSNLREHLVNCFDERKFTMFPIM